MDSLRVNVFPLTSSSFKLEDDLYFADSLYEEGKLRQSAHRSSPLKVEICMFLFCYTGTVSIRINQENLILTKNNVLITMPGSILEEVRISESDEVILLAFDRDAIPHDIRAIGMSSFFTKSFSTLNSIYKLSPERMSSFKQLYTATRDILRPETDKATQQSVLLGFAYITLGILNGWGRTEDSDSSGKVPRSQRIVAAFISDIRQYAVDEHEVAFYAERAALTTKYFSRLIIRETGKRPLDHIREYLALEAKCQLASGRYTIKQVADSLNFSDSSSFTRFFRSETGYTPAEFSASLLV